ncbi:toxin glutamine deamidase domain-containing protein [Yersinia enterocolitica]|uniref:toxin glutamine deamidase domain-containing protein n=1 Tax=Yersinia enterocolitica TaxID=630 RepID=UPI0021551EEA|nr:toxin glutamine deamidase domain-containing protein [Yersinia enterocolitica]
MKVTAPPATPAVLPDSTLSRSSSCLSLSTTPATDVLGFDEFSEKECELAKNSASANSLKIITNTVVPDGKKPSEFEGSKDRYLSDYLLNCVNAEGKPPLLLRPLAALLALLGIHGFGQTNCASCATAVAETLESNVLHQAMPKLRGADVKGIMGLPVNSGESFDERLTKLQQLKSTDGPLTILQQLKLEDELNGVIVIHRPARWQWLPGATQGHACNLIKFKDSNLIHFFDAQKKTHLSFDLSISQQEKPLNSTDQKKLSNQEAQISKFLGPIGAGGIDLYMKKMHADINKKAGASAPA